MILIETPTGQSLRPMHLLLMLYRYLSGVYQLGDVAGLNYIKGFIDGGGGQGKLDRVLTLCGHGIGEPEVWLSERLPNAVIDTVSFRQLDTQLLQFLRTAGRSGIAAAFDRFREVLEPFPALYRLLDDEGLVPYWELQAEEWSAPRRSHVNVYSDNPLRIPDTRVYDLIYVSQGLRYLDVDAVMKLRRHVRGGGWLSILVPASSEAAGERFADSMWTTEAKHVFNQLLGRRGYPPARDTHSSLDIQPLVTNSEYIRFSVPASAKSMLVGELLLYSMHEHLSDRVRLEVLAETLDTLSVADVSVREILQLFMIQGEFL
jgi:hypothetical protein